MTLLLNLPSPLATRLTTLAEQQGVPVETFVVTIITEYLDTHALVTDTQALHILQGDADVFSEAELQQMLYGTETDTDTQSATSPDSPG